MRRRPARNRGARPDAAAADALAQPGTAATRSRTGRIQGNLYVLHDEPLSPFEAMQLRCRLPRPGESGADPCRQGGTDRGHEHAARRLPRTAALRPHALPTRLQVLAQRMARHGWTTPGYPQEGRTTNPKKARKPCFGMARARLWNPKQGRNPHRTAHFGFRRRTVQYVLIV